MKFNISPKATMKHCFFGMLAALLAVGSFSSCSNDKSEQNTVTVQSLNDSTDQLPVDTVSAKPADTTATATTVAPADTAIQDIKGQEDPALEGEKQFIVVTGSNVRLRKTPEIKDDNIIKDKSGKPVYPKKGERLQFYREEGDFCFVSYNDELVYIAKKFTAPAKK